MRYLVYVLSFVYLRICILKGAENDCSWKKRKDGPLFFLALAVGGGVYAVALVDLRLLKCVTTHKAIGIQDLNIKRSCATLGVGPNKRPGGGLNRSTYLFHHLAIQILYHSNSYES